MSLDTYFRELIREAVREEMQHFAGAEREKLLTADEVAAWVGESRATVYQWKREGHLRAVMISETHMRFAPEEVRRFIREGGVKVVASDSGPGVEFASEANQ